MGSWRGRLGVNAGSVATSVAASSAEMRGVVAVSRSRSCWYSLHTRRILSSTSSKDCPLAIIRLTVLRAVASA